MRASTARTAENTATVRNSVAEEPYTLTRVQQLQTLTIFDDEHYA